VVGVSTRREVAMTYTLMIVALYAAAFTILVRRFGQGPRA
jgi:hypothetical protein